jgi:hypothetical protein
MIGGLKIRPQGKDPADDTHRRQKGGDDPGASRKDPQHALLVAITN